MQVTQIYDLLSTIYTEVVGDSEIALKEDLTNIVDVGNVLLSKDYREPYVNSLLNRIGRMVFVDRPYTGIAPNVMRQGWEWGSIMSKSRTKDFTAVENPAWTLTAGETVNQFEYNPPVVQTTLFNELVTWEIDCSFVQRQIKQSFLGYADMDRFLGMIRSTITNNQVQNIDNLIMRTLNCFIGRRIYKGIGVVDLLASYNKAFGTSLTPSQAIVNKEWYRHAAYLILLYNDRLRPKTAIFSENEPGYTTFTPKEYRHLVLLSDFACGLDVYLQSETFHNGLTSLGNYETVPYWQAPGNDFSDLEITSSINIVLPQITPTVTVNHNYIVGFLFDNDALGMLEEDRRVEAAYNSKGEYWNNFFKVDTRLFNDPAENGIVFTMGSGTITPTPDPTPAQ
ncbi:MAG: hypothetical protein K2I06_08380 [Ruminococcus sp.]|nr:hypothetical protein [Ruminococcus sp.]